MDEEDFRRKQISLLETIIDRLDDIIEFMVTPVAAPAGPATQVVLEPQTPTTNQ
jgi:hypothetical protein